ncbi:Ig-like domain-containing protein [Jeongeupia sp. HS-3]|uniref:Ig-like domain-containing protein n=1 Tax=Jeongeupia sp. HS-3 TaxID=1009682 RepID=UPI00190FE152
MNLSGGAATSRRRRAGAGTATASGTTITYTPAAGYTGADSFTYRATNAGGTSAPATVNRRRGQRQRWHAAAIRLP